MKYLFAVGVALAILVSSMAATMGQNPAQPETETDTSKSTETTKEMNVGEWIASLNFQEIMDECNKTYKIDMEFLKSLNESGSYPDETEKTQKCYMRCYLEKTGMMNEEGDLVKDISSAIFAGQRNGHEMTDIADIVSDCADRRGYIFRGYVSILHPEETCRCERAYNYVKCIMEAEIEKYEN